MSTFEALNIFIACIAAFISLVVWGCQRKLQREANELQRATAALAQKQLEILLREEKGTNTARISAVLEKNGKGYRFRIQNIGNADAKDVEFKLLVDIPEHNVLIKSDVEQKFPVKKLHPGEGVSLIAALHLGSPTAFNAEVRWLNPDGAVVQDEIFVAL